MNLLAAFANLKAFAFDMDGVLTDGQLYLMPDGEWVRSMHIHDGYALQAAVKKGFPVCVISGSESEPVKARLVRLGVVDIFMGISDKRAIFEEWLTRLSIPQEQALFMGDDVPDIGVLSVAGMSCCPADAVPEVREMVSYISPVSGGKGCVRDVLEKVLRLQDKWDSKGDTRSL